MPDKQVIRSELLVIIDNLLDRREGLSDQIYLRVLADIRRMSLERRMLEREAEVALEVCNERDENGKLVYPNEATRKAQITDRLAKDDEFNKWIKGDEARKRYIARSRNAEGLLSAEIKKLEAMERLYFIDLEKE